MALYVPYITSQRPDVICTPIEKENTDQNSSYKNFPIYVQGTLPKGELLTGTRAYTISTAEINCWDK